MTQSSSQSLLTMPGEAWQWLTMGFAVTRSGADSVVLQDLSLFLSFLSCFPLCKMESLTAPPGTRKDDPGIWMVKRGCGWGSALEKLN